MTVKFTKNFLQKFYRQIDFIAHDKPQAARKFKADVFAHIKQLPTMPYKNRQSVFYEETHIRDLIFKGYIIIYRIQESKQEIEIFGFIKYVEKP